MISFKEWRDKLKVEMGGATDAIVGKCPGPNADYRVQGALCDKSAKKKAPKNLKKGK
jgi:hypothetical protein